MPLNLPMSSFFGCQKRQFTRMTEKKTNDNNDSDGDDGTFDEKYGKNTTKHTAVQILLLLSKNGLLGEKGPTNSS